MNQPSARIHATSRQLLGLTALLFLSSMPGCAIKAYEPGPDDTSKESPSPSGQDATSTGEDTFDDPSADDSDQGNEPTLGLVPFDKLVQQRVTWIDVDVTVESAASGMHVVNSIWGEEYLEAGHAITLTVQNRTRFGTGLSSQHWDLILADGTRVEGGTGRLQFGPLDALPLELWFDDDSGQTLDGAQLELNGSKYGAFHPLYIPLDTPVEEEPVLELTQLVGQLFPAEPDEDSVWQHEVLFARVSYNSDGYNGDERARAEYGKKLVDLVVRSTNLASGSKNLFDETYHLNVGGVGVSTQSFVNELPDAGEAVDVPVVFQINEDVTAFEVEFNTGLESSPIWKTLHIDLAEIAAGE